MSSVVINFNFILPASIGELSIVFCSPFDWGTLAIASESKIF